MKYYARIENGKVVEVFDLHYHFPTRENIDGLFSSSMLWVAAPDNVEEGWLLLGKDEVAPPSHLDFLFDRVDQAAGAARARYITVAAGQGETYMQKTADANAYKAAGYTGAVPLMIEAEANAVGCTAKQAADLIIAQANAWLVKGSQIEQTRRAWKLTLATSEDRLVDCAAAEAELNAL